ncbi:hypothetical protein TRFO_06908 [Tritrichomonas foetus]|uniref:USP domain-containing protein n=1 Tax=Tritrichomonas foetus TaxID=1144522 RepID=A0A1J4JV40_9EUKA|nr:hypothetical protein TRFO_06908 [Tritrichomonas foetus]|eukprot:OHT02867.1 hypothetical protein TRFO_06908 [Tritrichomonas foetus]
MNDDTNDDDIQFYDQKWQKPPPDPYENFLIQFDEWSEISNEYNYKINYHETYFTFVISRGDESRLKVQILLDDDYISTPQSFVFRIQLLPPNPNYNTIHEKRIDFTPFKKADCICFDILQKEINEENGFVVNNQVQFSVRIKPYFEPIHPFPIRQESDPFGNNNYNDNPFLNDNHFCNFSSQSSLDMNSFDFPSRFSSQDSQNSFPKDVIEISKPSPYAGLKNQGATCYMNSLLQALFHLPAFRRLVFEMNHNIDKPDDENIPLNLKILFAQMQLFKQPASTANLTKSFGWTDKNTFMQHDIQEFCRVLLGNLEDKMKESDLDYGIKYIFKGVYRTFTKGIHKKFVKYVENVFYDLSLQVKDCSDIYEAFDKYVEKEILSGKNQYQSEEFGLQDAEMGLEFMEFPRVLYLHLKRFEIDPILNRSIKINSSFQFYNQINLSKYLAKDADPTLSAEYELFGVLVHSGSSLSGHYYAFLRPTVEEQWFEFNDSSVYTVDSKTAIENNFGGENHYNNNDLNKDSNKDINTETNQGEKAKSFNEYSYSEKTYSAYMLIYVKKYEKEKLFKEVENDLISEDIKEKIHQISDVSDSLTFLLYSKETTIIPNSQYGKLIFNFSTEDGQTLRIKKNLTHKELYHEVASLYNEDVNSIELWQFTSDGLLEKLPNNYSSLSQYIKGFCLFVFIDDNSKTNSQNSFGLSSSSAQSSSDISLSNLFLIKRELPIFAFIYCPFTCPPLHYLFSKRVEKNSNIQKYFENEIKIIFQIRFDVEINVYIKTQKLEKIENYSKTFHEFEGNSIFVIEFTKLSTWDKVDFPQNNFQFKQNEKVINFLDNMSLVEYNAKTYYDFSTDFILLKVNSFTQTKKVRIPGLIHFHEFRQFLTTVFQEGNDFIIFKKNSKKPMKCENNDLMCTLVQPFEQEYSIVFINNQYFTDDGQIAFDKIIRMEIEFFYDQFNIQSNEELFDEDLTISNIIKRFQNNFENNSKIRVLQIENGKICKILEDECKIGDVDGSLRIEKIPDDQIDELHFIKIQFSKDINKKSFLMNYENMKISELKSKIMHLMEISPENFVLLKFKYFNDSNKEIHVQNDDVFIDDFDDLFSEVLIEGKYQQSSHKYSDNSLHLYN